MGVSIIMPSKLVKICCKQLNTNPAFPGDQQHSGVNVIGNKTNACVNKFVTKVVAK